MLLPPERWADREIFLKQRKEPRCWDGLIVTAKLSHFAIWDLFVSIKNTTFQQKHFFSLKIAPKEETYFDWMITFANSHNFIVVHWHQALLVVTRDDAFSSTGSRRRARHLKEEVRTVFWVSKFFLLFMIWTVFMEEVDVRAPKTRDRIWGSINALCPGYWTTSRFNSLINASIN
jgi:hypothetical protein